ncbi:hypothetical protein TYRP_018318, partial [Tyrophagus putrescentiae]
MTDLLTYCRVAPSCTSKLRPTKDPAHWYQFFCIITVVEIVAGGGISSGSFVSLLSSSYRCKGCTRLQIDKGRSTAEVVLQDARSFAQFSIP